MYIHCCLGTVCVLTAHMHAHKCGVKGWGQLSFSDIVMFILLKEIFGY